MLTQENWHDIISKLSVRDSEKHTVSKGFEKSVSKINKKVLDKRERTWYDLKVAAVLMKNGSTK